MKHSNPTVQYLATPEWADRTAHGLLVAAYFKAQSQGFFQALDHALKVKMKTVRYRPADKLKTLWASIVVGCAHTCEINDKLGAHEKAAAALFGLKRFPDQSQVNRLLCALTPEQLPAWRELHLGLLARHTRAKAASRWLRLASQERLLAVDLDQRAVVVAGRGYELASPGYFGRKRGKYGYQLSAAFLGGEIGEVLDEYFDPGRTPMASRLEVLLGSLDQFCARTGIARHRVLLRGDAQLGTPMTIAKVQAHGYHYLFKGLSAARAEKLARQAPESAVFWRVENGAERLPRWMCDLGWREHRDESAESRGQVIKARTLLLAREEWAPRAQREGAATRAKEALTPRPRPKVIKMNYLLTDLEARHLPVEAVLSTYDDRATIERYFCDEQQALGARQVRTHHYAGAALFQFLVATTNNLLRWLQHSTFRQTELERLGLGRLIRQAMQIPARLRQRGESWIVELPQQHHLVKQLVKSWSALSLIPGPS